MNSVPCRARSEEIFHLHMTTYVCDGEFLKILIFNDRTEKKKFSSCISELENDFGSSFIFNYTSSFPNAVNKWPAAGQYSQKTK